MTDLNEREIKTISECLKIQAVFGIYEPEFIRAQQKLAWAMHGIRRRMLVGHNLQPNFASRTKEGLVEEKLEHEAWVNSSA